MNNRILIVSASEKSSDALARILKKYSWNSLDFASSGAEARRAMLRGRYALIIINSPLKDEQGSELAASLVHSTSSSVILIAKTEIADMLASKVEGDSVFVIPKPLQTRQFLSAVRLALAFSARIAGVEKEVMKYEKKYDEFRTVSRAKCVLIEKEKLTEQEAHRFIEKQSMDRRESKLQVSNGILKRYL
ncbi:MAG TPA: ANTAR domain-containing protein [Candidatus Monoglobus merdigallinarum]|uniref:Stage 0 sporulation protein A homolog n=1 Tax=Candidatus Monoglobus merdigallinarum TaxID=2838698 RepID=A0A9D1PQ62_9FIRM|nr:ANTAR domain-containing protein [Candidatus Monoglobus merdigallinarum]